MENWKSNLCGLLGSHGCHPCNQLNEALHKWCEEFTRLCNQHSGMKAVCSYSPYYGTSRLEIRMGSYKEFKAEVSYAQDEDGALLLKLKYTASFDFEKQWRMILKSKEGSDYYIWQEEEFLEMEAREQPYVMQLLINRFQSFLNGEKV